MKQSLILAGVTLFLISSGVTSYSASADDVKIGTVDMQKALQTVDAGRKAKSKLEKDFNNKKKELQAEETAIKKMTEDFKKQALVMNDEARGKKQAELQDRILKFQEHTARSQSEIQQEERELTSPLITKLRGIIGNLAKKKGYTVVLEKNENTVLYSQEKDDLTNEAVSIFDKQSGSDNSHK